jgi:hypothetical protein
MSKKPRPNTEADINKQYHRRRRYDTDGTYRIGPKFLTKDKLCSIDINKPGKLCAVFEQRDENALEFGMLTYLWTFTDQHEKQEIDLSFLKSFIDAGVDINAGDKYGQTILHALVRDWHPDVTLFAIRNNANINVQDTYGRSPLHLAAALNCTTIARILLLNGALVDIETFKELQTPLHYAAKYNSLETLKLLIKFKGSITKEDSNGRCALFLAAEKGSAEVAQYLLDIGAPSGIIDNEGNAGLACLIEKIPSTAFYALQQFLTYNTLTHCEMYLSTLEANKARTKYHNIVKTPLEVITTYEDMDLILHPVIQQCIKIKWKLFGKVDTIRKLILTIIYSICWIVLGYTFSDSAERYYIDENKTWKQHGWKIVFEIIIILFNFYFFFQEFNLKRETMKHHDQWRERRQYIVKSQSCHPMWSNEQESIEADMERIRSVPSLAGKQKFWFFYEWLMLFLILVVISTRVLSLIYNQNIKLFIAHKFLFGLNMVFSFLRMIKICIRFPYFSIFLKVTSLAITSFIQIGLLYIQIYIPFTSAFFLIFGVIKNNNGTSSTLRRHGKSLTPEEEHLHNRYTIDHIFFAVYESSFAQDYIYQIESVDSVTKQILVTLFHVLITFITFSLFIALCTSKFTVNYKKYVAEASLLQASTVLQLEKRLSNRDKLKIETFYVSYCNPMTLTEKTFDDTFLEQVIQSKLNLTKRLVSDINNRLRIADDRYQENNDKNICKSIVKSTVECMSKLSDKEEAFCDMFRSELSGICKKQGSVNKFLSTNL